MNKDIEELFDRINNANNDVCSIWNSLLWTTNKYKNINTTKAYNEINELIHKRRTCQEILLKINELK
jgi:hypothetical protein